MAKIAGAVERGATTVLLQGGHNPSLPLDYYLDLVRETRRRFPGVLPHFFTASEIQTMARVSTLPVSEVLARLRDAGQRTLPGGGAEILSERVRLRIAPEEGRARQLAGGPPRGAPARAPVHGHHDVRPRRGAGGRPGPPGRRARPPGRDRRLHGVRPLVLQAGQHAAGEVDQALRRAQRLLPDAGAVALLPGQHASRPGVLVLGGQAGRADRAPLRGRRLGRNALRGERPQGGGLRQQDHGGRDRGPDPGGRLPARPADHALRAVKAF